MKQKAMLVALAAVVIAVLGALLLFRWHTRATRVEVAPEQLNALLGQMVSALRLGSFEDRRVERLDVTYIRGSWVFGSSLTLRFSFDEPPSIEGLDESIFEGRDFQFHHLHDDTVNQHDIFTPGWIKQLALEDGQDGWIAHAGWHYPGGASGDAESPIRAGWAVRAESRQLVLAISDPDEDMLYVCPPWLKGIIMADEPMVWHELTFVGADWRRWYVLELTPESRRAGEWKSAGHRSVGLVRSVAGAG
ncbi:MAG: hypothetical protein AAF995_04780 [Planctomycetota bacterium]